VIARMQYGSSKQVIHCNMRVVQAVYCATGGCVEQASDVGSQVHPLHHTCSMVLLMQSDITDILVRTILPPYQSCCGALLCRCHYTGRLASNNVVFDSSYERGRPLTFKVITPQQLAATHAAKFCVLKNAVPASAVLAGAMLRTQNKRD
jgi:hypothetical protein